MYICHRDIDKDTDLKFPIADMIQKSEIYIFSPRDLQLTTDQFYELANTPRTYAGGI